MSSYLNGNRRLRTIYKTLVDSEQADAEAAIHEQYASSQITLIEREEMLAQLRDDSMSKLQDASTAMGDLAANSGNSTLAEQVSELNSELERTKHHVSEVNRAIVDELKGSMQSAFKDILTGAKSLREGLISILEGIASQLANSVAQTLTESLLKMGGGAGGGGFLGSFLGLFGGATKKATGGLISGPGTGTSDSVPAMLSNGEYVVRAASARKHLSLLNHLNQTGNLPSAAGGAIPQSMHQGLGPIQSTVNVSPQVVIQTGQLIDALRGDSAFERTLVQVVSANKARLGIR